MKKDKLELFKKVYIKSEADLPKEIGTYLAKVRFRINYIHYHPNDKDYWLGDVVWYLLPFKEQKSQLGAEEILQFLSDKMYNDKIAHDYKDGKIDYHKINEWFLLQKDAIKEYRNQPRQELREKLFEFLYNPMIEESCYCTMSIHKTRKGAEMAMEFHRAEALKEFNDHVNECDEKMKQFYKEESPFGIFEDWKIEEIEIID